MFETKNIWIPLKSQTKNQSKSHYKIRGGALKRAKINHLRSWKELFLVLNKKENL